MNAGFILRFIDRRLSKWVVMNSEKTITTLSAVIAKAYLNYFLNFNRQRTFEKSLAAMYAVAAKFGFDELCEVRYLAQHSNLHGNEVQANCSRMFAWRRSRYKYHQFNLQARQLPPFVYTSFFGLPLQLMFGFHDYTNSTKMDLLTSSGTQQCLQRTNSSHSL